MEKILKDDNAQIEVTAGITIEEFNDKYNKLLKEVKDKYGYISNIKIRCESHEYNDGENYVENICIYFKRYETDEEFERRKNWIEYRKKEQKEREIKLMKQYIQSYKTEAIEFINNLNKN